MRIRAAVAVPAASAAVAALLLTATQGRAATGDHARPVRCAGKSLTVEAKAVPGAATVLRVGVTNRGAHACVVDRVPTVTFGDLDGGALPTPEGATAAYRLAAGRTAYADVRTVGDPADPEARPVDTVTVAASAAQGGHSFTAAQLGTGQHVLVWEPVTTWWQRTRAAADRAIGLG
ncbi:DUF4232 domain-containing protein [Streptomyces sp. NPDC001852]|uniref:DUF4232 domain-containing protein n=1 Tax=Streptomyces sp. NPDC001852 TaxID=3364619 RepID=UPI0036CC13D2